MENVNDVAFGNCFTEMRDVGFYNSGGSPFQVLGRITDSQLEGSVYNLRDLFMGVGMFRQLRALFKNPVGNGHIVGMEKTDVYSGKQVSFLKGVNVKKAHTIILG